MVQCGVPTVIKSIPWESRNCQIHPRGIPATFIPTPMGNPRIPRDSRCPHPRHTSALNWSVDVPYQQFCASQELSVIKDGQRLNHKQFPVYLGVTLNELYRTKSMWQRRLPSLKAGTTSCSKQVGTSRHASPVYATHLQSIVLPCGRNPQIPGQFTANWIVLCDWSLVHYDLFNCPGCPTC